MENIMDLSKANSEQISDYKESWKNRGFVVPVESTLDVKGKDWCRHKLERWMWSMKAFADAEHHEFCFEHLSDADDFARQFNSKYEKMSSKSVA
jgi:hypothetical protein